jgi:hypothetical protein
MCRAGPDPFSFGLMCSRIHCKDRPYPREQFKQYMYMLSWGAALQPWLPLCLHWVQTTLCYIGKHAVAVVASGDSEHTCCNSDYARQRQQRMLRTALGAGTHQRHTCSLTIRVCPLGTHKRHQAPQNVRLAQRRSTSEKQAKLFASKRWHNTPIAQRKKKWQLLCCPNHIEAVIREPKKHAESR